MLEFVEAAGYSVGDAHVVSLVADVAQPLENVF